MKYITYFIKFFYRIRFWLIIAPIIVASLVYWKTNNTPRDYTTTCSIYTGIITGVNILSESGISTTSYTQGSMMDNLLNIITADQTLKQVSLRLYARIWYTVIPIKTISIQKPVIIEISTIMEYLFII